MQLQAEMSVFFLRKFAPRQQNNSLHAGLSEPSQTEELSSRPSRPICELPVYPNQQSSDIRLDWLLTIAGLSSRFLFSPFFFFRCERQKEVFLPTKLAVSYYHRPNPASMPLDWILSHIYPGLAYKRSIRGGVLDRPMEYNLQAKTPFRTDMFFAWLGLSLPNLAPLLLWVVRRFIVRLIGAGSEAGIWKRGS